MSSRDFTHELHRTTKTIGYSKVIETLQSMARIQPSGANEIPTTFRQNRAERDLHNTFGSLGPEFFSQPEIINHIDPIQKTYFRNPSNTFNQGLMEVTHTFPTTTIFTPDGVTKGLNLHGVFDVESMNGAAAPFVNSPMQNRGSYTALHIIAVNPIALSITSAHHSIFHSTLNPSIAAYNRGVSILHPGYVDFPADPEGWHVLLSARYDGDGTLESAVYINGTKHVITHPVSDANSNHLLGNQPPYLRFNRANGYYVSHITQFSQNNDDDFDQEAWIAKDRAGVRDLTDPDTIEWFTWRGFSPQIEEHELPAAYGL